MLEVNDSLSLVFDVVFLFSESASPKLEREDQFTCSSQSFRNSKIVKRVLTQQSIPTSLAVDPILCGPC